MFFLVSISNDVLPNKKVCMKQESFDSKTLLSVIIKVLKRVFVIMKYVAMEKKNASCVNGSFIVRPLISALEICYALQK